MFHSHDTESEWVFQVLQAIEFEVNMRIEQDVKLDFKDVLIRPKRSTLSSRAEVDLNRTYIFRNSGQTWTGIPIIAANMDHTGTLAMASALAQHGLLTAMSKFITKSAWLDFKKNQANALSFSMVSAGSGANDFKLLEEVMAICDAPFICLDVANGYSEAFTDVVKRVRDAFPSKTIVAGNVVTGEMVEELILSGAGLS